jgi:hypothetical protein
MQPVTFMAGVFILLLAAQLLNLETSVTPE